MDYHVGGDLVKITIDEALLKIIVGRRIRKQRISQGYSQEAVCRGIVSQSALSLIENGKYPLDSFTLTQLATRLGDDWLLVRANELQSESSYQIETDVLFTLLNCRVNSWFNALKKPAMDLIQYYFTIDELQNVELLSDLIISNNADDDEYVNLASYYKARVHVKRFEYVDAFKWFRKALDHASNLTPLIRAEAWYYSGYSAFFLERISDSQDACDRCSKLCQEHQFLKLWAMVYGLQGTIFRKYGRYVEAIGSLRKSNEMLLQVGGREADLFRIQVSIADNMELLGNYKEAEELILKADAEYSIMDNPIHYVSRSSAYRILARLQHYKGESAQASTYASLAVQYAEMSTDTWSMSWSYLLEAGLALEHQEKIRLCNRALALAEEGKQQLQAAIASECLAVLSGSALDSHVVNSLRMYRDLALRGYPDQYPTLKLLPIC